MLHARSELRLSTLSCAPTQLMRALGQTVQQSCRGKTNFFERRVGEYQKSSVMAGLAGGVHQFDTECDF